MRRNHQKSTPNARHWPILCITLFISSCSLLKPHEQSLTVVSTPIERERLDLSSPPPVALEPLHWYVLSPENAATVFAEMQGQGADPAIFGLSDDGYEALAFNFARLRHYIAQQRAIIEQYRAYYEPPLVENNAQP